MAEVGELHPGAVLVRSALRVEFRVVHEHARLGHVLLVVGGLLGVGVGPDLLVLRLGEAGGTYDFPVRVPVLRFFFARAPYSFESATGAQRSRLESLEKRDSCSWVEDWGALGAGTKAEAEAREATRRQVVFMVQVYRLVKSEADGVPRRRRAT